MQVYAFHLMPWPYLPADFAETHDTAWVVCENELYDPVRGHEVYNRYLDELELAEKLGFDGVCVNEHHQNAYGLMPSPNIMAAALARRTSRMKLVVLGNVLSIYDHPLRVAEEIAEMDVITGGRMVSGQVVGTGNEFFSYNVNPTYARERFREAHELILKSWTHPGPFAWEGEHYRFRYVNVWPRPYQQPHPPVWIPGSGSRDTCQWVAQKRYTYMVLPTLAPYAVRLGVARYFQECCQAEGYEPRHEQIGWGIGVYVAETDARAVAEYEPHFRYYAGNLLRNRDTFNAPPGHSSVESAISMARNRQTRERVTGDFDSWSEVERRGYVVVGSPATVRDRLLEIARETGLGTLIPNFSVGNVPHDLTRKSMELFASEVMPALRPVNTDAPPAAEPLQAR
ncbi:MAG: LLM class flavin-dependent oxidoreductase [Candidatus Dormibacteraeota bacterium]|nr:LLM class flavin-dependent oxidoreductase [Candidatus Dormibacteraeota bacterium]